MNNENRENAHFTGSVSLFRYNKKISTSKKEELSKLAILNRTARIICRKCFCRLPLNAHVCRKCKNPDIRYKKNLSYFSNNLYGCHKSFNFDKNTKQKMTNKLNN